jgi:phage terminase small subunit
MNRTAAKFFNSFVSYMTAFAADAERFASDGLLRPPKGTLNPIGAQEWRRVAPRLYAMDRLLPREIIGLHAYCASFSYWFALRQRAETFKHDVARQDCYVAIKDHLEQSQRNLKQIARSFGFFLDDSGRMNLEQPLPLKRRSKGAKLPRASRDQLKKE